MIGIREEGKKKKNSQLCVVRASALVLSISAFTRLISVQNNIIFSHHRSRFHYRGDATFIIFPRAIINLLPLSRNGLVKKTNTRKVL